VELLRSVTFGQYVPVDSAVHRLDPRTKILATVLLVAVLLAVHRVEGLGVLAVFLAAVTAAGRIPFGYLLRGLRPVLWILGVALVLQVLFGGEPGHPVARWGALVVTRESLWLAFFYGARLVLLVVATTLMTFVTSPVELADGLERLMGPFQRVGVPAHELALMMTIALRFIPTLLEETEKIMKAQMARGAEFTRGSLVQRARSLVPLLVPLFLSAFRRADALALAMEARCYRGGAHRTRMTELRLGARDFVAFGIVSLASLVALLPPGAWRAVR
jgi:energy-coupling factor transport system permease protein